MHKELVNTKGVLRLDYYYNVNDVPVRRHYDKQYQPDTVHITLNVGRSFGPTLPEPDGLTPNDLLGETSPVSSVDLIGKRLKKNGEPGTLDVTEHLYGFSRNEGLDWVQSIINEILLSLGNRS